MRSSIPPSPVWVIALVLLAQFSAVAYVFPISEILSMQPLTTIDHAYHQYQTDLALELARQGLLAGYDTTFGAGYIGGLPYNLSGKLPALAAWLLSPFLDSVQAYKLYVFIAQAIAPAGVVLAAWLLRLPTPAVAISGVLGLALWWASAFHWYNSAGMVAFVLISFFSLPFCVLLERVMRSGSSWLLSIHLGVFGGAMMLAHPLFPVPIFFFALALCIVAPKYYLKLSTLGKLVAAAAIAVGSNWVWIVYLLENAGLATPSVSAKYQALIGIDIVWRGMLGQWAAPAMGSKLYPLLLLGACLSLFLVRGDAVRWVRASFLAWAAIVLYAALGAALPGVDALQPNRFAPVGYLFLIVPFSLTVHELVNLLRSTSKRRLFAYTMLGVLGVGSTPCLAEVAREIGYGNHGRYGAQPPEVRGIGAVNRDLLRWLANNTDNTGRVLFETSLGRVHDRAHIAGLLAEKSVREFIGGPYPYAFFAGFWDGFVFGKPIDTIPPAHFLEYLDLYNVRWILAHSSAARRYLSRLESVRADETIGPVQAFTVMQAPSFFLEGEGKILERETNRLVLRTVGEPGQAVTLKYHWVPGLKARDGSAVEGVYRLDDPQPFVRVSPKGAVVELSIPGNRHKPSPSVSEANNPEGLDK